jgi:uncharacterized protein (TIGR03435 family)
MLKRFARNRGNHLLLSVVWAALVVPAMTAQKSGAAHASDKKAPVFDVVSIRPSKPGGAPGGGVTQNGYVMRNLSLWSTVMAAYIPHSLWSNDRLLGAPPWMLNEEYDVVAKVDEATADAWKNLTSAQREEKARPMLQALLADRCKLVLHHTVPEAPVFVLVVGKHGPKFTETKPGQPLPSNAVHLPDGGAFVPGAGDLKFFGTSMASLAAFLSRSSPRPIQDKTGLPGSYDFVLRRHDQGYVSASDPDPSTPFAMEGLGLTLKSAKAPTDTLVIDHIERPSPN